MVGFGGEAGGMTTAPLILSVCWGPQGGAYREQQPVSRCHTGSYTTDSVDLLDLRRQKVSSNPSDEHYVR